MCFISLSLASYPLKALTGAHFTQRAHRGKWYWLKIRVLLLNCNNYFAANNLILAAESRPDLTPSLAQTVCMVNVSDYNPAGNFDHIIF